MIILLSGPSHVGKTALAQGLLEVLHISYLSLDHLKMGLIRSGQTELTPMDDDLLTAYLWPIAREIIKTAIENRQDLIIEGLYIPYDWQTAFEPEYLAEIQAYWLIFSENYIRQHYADIRKNANVIENRLTSESPSQETLIREHERTLANCQKFGLSYLLIEEDYRAEIEALLQEIRSKLNFVSD